jgi:hypothetical protein
MIPNHVYDPNILHSRAHVYKNISSAFCEYHNSSVFIRDLARYKQGLCLPNKPASNRIPLEL